MKFEKLTDNKIRVIFNTNDINSKSIKFEELLLATPKSQKFVLSILNEAKEQLNFDTTGYKLLIESFLKDDGIIVFTITKYLDKSKKASVTKKKASEKFKIFEFESFDDFLDFKSSVNNSPIINNINKNSSLYNYNNTYFLLINKFSTRNKDYISFNNTLLEFSNKVQNSSLLKLKLNEYGKLISKEVFL